jgi:hypothetical protein
VVVKEMKTRVNWEEPNDQIANQTVRLAGLKTRQSEVAEYRLARKTTKDVNRQL